jgi:kynureninase
LLTAELGSAWGSLVTLISPADPSARGCQLSLLLSIPVRGVNERLQSEGVICDVREPHVLRVAPTPLYNSFADCWKFVHAFKRALDLK